MNETCCPTLAGFGLAAAPVVIVGGVLPPPPLTVTVEDPKFFTKPWVAMDKFPMRRQSSDYDIIEMLCVPSEAEAYSHDFGDAASGIDSKDSK